MTQIAKVAVAAATYAIDKPYDYLVPSGMELSVGCRVTVPFGRGNRTAEGMVLQLRQEVPAKPLKAIRSLLDQESVLSEKEIRLALWMRQRYFCTFYDALHTILPAAVWYRYREILEPLPHGRGGGPYGTGAGGVPDALRRPAGARDPLHRTGGGYPVGAVSDEKEGTGFRGDGDQPQGKGPHGGAGVLSRPGAGGAGASGAPPPVRPPAV